ncbi:hypothetical protein [Streptomyces mirabilis]|uniref:Restriction system protein n=1 Tax=Streptomyces mirabilis TaxID=68239 RepID=A0A1I2DDS3_9ACTN|nr:hypothetical protein [Streptomyces mirabilis]SFE78742.1 restriction system protein [Streptomyces mirabilis]
MSTSPYQQFRDNLTYAEELIEAARYIREDLSRDLYRAAWVQAVSALDHWVHQEVYERAVAIAMNTTAPRPAQLEKLPIPWMYMERTRHSGEPLAVVFREALESQLDRRTFQNQEDIGSAFQLVLAGTSAGVMWGRVAQDLGKTKEQLKLRHAEVLKRRNQISHSSDVDPSTGKRRLITHEQAADAVKWIEDLARSLSVAIR